MMNCALIASDHVGNFTVIRTVEVLYYDFAKGVVRLVLVIHAKCNEAGSLRILHPGNVRLKFCEDAPCFRHPDEKKLGKHFSLLACIYAPAFSQVGDKLRHVQTLSNNNTWVTQDPSDVIIYHKKQDEIHPILGGNGSNYVPFTEWEFELFEKGTYLIPMIMEFSGESFDRLVGNTNEFTVDGPMGLLGRIRSELIPLYTGANANIYDEHRGFFEKKLIEPLQYDIIVMNENIQIDNPSEYLITSRTRQAHPVFNATRWTSTAPTFSLGLTRLQAPVGV